jgi:hypothetical protein
LRAQDLFDPRSVLPRRRQLAMVAALIALPSITIIAGMIVSDMLIAHRCPPNTLFFGSTSAARVPFFLICLSAELLWLVSRPLLVNAAKQGRLIGGFDPETLMSWSNRGLVFAVAAGILVAVAGSYSQFCVLGDRITFRTGMLSDTETYPWSAVQSVVATCRHYSGRESTDDIGYTVVMTNGRRIDLSYSDTRLPIIVKAASSGLRGVSYGYDSTHVSRYCDPIRTRLLLPRPTDLD